MAAVVLPLCSLRSVYSLCSAWYICFLFLDVGKALVAVALEKRRDLRSRGAFFSIPSSHERCFLQSGERVAPGKKNELALSRASFFNL